jgi:hypothetical protein
MPLIDWHILCRDWQHDQRQIDREDMQAGVLYYYSSATGQLRLSEVGPFTQLQRLVISVSVRHDDELGWVIVPRHYHIYFPPPDSLINVRVGERKSKFQVVNSERKIAMEMIPAENGQWEAQSHMQQVYMLTSMESPDLLYDWLNSFMDVEAFLAQSFAPSLVALVEILRQGSEYALHADTLAYQKFLR